MIHDDKIEHTVEYDKFKLLKDNRKITKAHVRKLQAAFANPGSGRYRPILVNERLEIIDGQHRFMAWQENNMPIYYHVGPGLSTRDAQKLNALQRQWGPVDYAESFSKAGRKPYEIYLTARTTYMGTSHKVLVVYLTGDMGKSNDTEVFRNGLFEVPDFPKSEKDLNAFAETAVVFPGWKRQHFGLAIWTFLQNPDYDHKRMLTQLARFADKVGVHDTTTGYQRALERAYHHHLPVSKKLRLF